MFVGFVLAMFWVFYVIFRWPIFYGPVALTSVALLTGGMVSEVLRKQYRLPGYTRFFIGIPITTLSSAAMYVLQTNVSISKYLLI